MRKYYGILGLSPGATEEEIEQACRDLSKVWDPARFPNDPKLQAKAGEKLAEIDEAYEKLSNLTTDKFQVQAVDEEDEEPVENILKRRQLISAWVCFILWSVTILFCSFDDYTWGLPKFVELAVLWGVFGALSHVTFGREKEGGWFFGNTNIHIYSIGLRLRVAYLFKHDEQ